MIFKLHFVSGIGGKKTHRAGIPFHCNSNIHARFSSGCVRMFLFLLGKGICKKSFKNPELDISQAFQPKI